MRRIFFLAIFMLLFTTGCDQKPANQVNIPKNETKHTIEVYGTISALDIKNIMVDFPAVIEKVHVRDGQRVKKGDPLVTLNMNELKAQIKKKEKELSVARLELRKNNGDVELRKLLNNLKYEEELYQISEVLYKEGAISKYQLDGYYNSLESRRKSIEEIKLSLNNVENDRVYNIKIQNEKIFVLEYELKILRDKLNKSYLKNNVIMSDTENGLVYDIGYVPGDVADDQKKVLSIVNLNSIFVQADVPEDFIKNVRLDAQATIVPVADKLKKYKGKVANISNKAIQKNGETVIIVDILLNSTDDFLLPNFNVDVSISM